MAKAFDLVIRGGTIVTGDGASMLDADVAVSQGRIAEIGSVKGTGREEINASGKIVTPGFVDVHTHYDGQVTWESRMAPSSNHGVTTVVMGNCGVGFAPCRPQERDLLVGLMEGVEDVPDVVMTEGLPWTWETFPDYLDALDKRRADVDFAAQLPHSAVRVYTMGKRGADREPATPQDLSHMRSLTTEAIRAGALGVSTSRSLNHRWVDGRLAPSVESGVDEMLALAGGLRDAGTGVFQMIHEATRDVRPHFELMTKIARESGRPLSFTMLQRPAEGEVWRDMLAGLDRAKQEGLTIRGQIFPRPMGMLYGLDLSYHPFVLHPSFQPIARLPLAEKIKAMRDPALRARLLSEKPEHNNPFMMSLVKRMEGVYAFGDPPNYEPTPDERLAVIAERRGVPFLEFLYDLLLERNGQSILYLPANNFAGNSLAPTAEMMAHERTIIGLGDGGAHYGMICDSSYPTFVLTRWVRDTKTGEGFSLPWAVEALTRKPAEAVGLNDRGLIARGYKADINVIDLDQLQLRAPRVTYDLPAGGRRLTQQADGFIAAIVSGSVTYRNGDSTNVFPGRLVRGARSN